MAKDLQDNNRKISALTIRDIEVAVLKVLKDKQRHSLEEIQTTASFGRDGILSILAVTNEARQAHVPDQEIQHALAQAQVNGVNFEGEITAKLFGIMEKKGLINIRPTLAKPYEITKDGFGALERHERKNGNGSALSAEPPKNGKDHKRKGWNRHLNSVDATQPFWEL